MLIDIILENLKKIMGKVTIRMLFTILDMEKKH